MNDRIIRYNTTLLITVTSLTFIGFYLINILSINAGMLGNTRSISIIVRMIIGICCALLLFHNFKNKNRLVLWFLLFVFIYLIRILIDYISNEYFYITYAELIFYFVSFSVIPFISVVKVDFKKVKLNSVFMTFLLISFAFSLLSTLLYSKFVGSVGRLSSSTAGEDVVTPLTLSYCATLIIGVIVFYLMYNKTSKKTILLSYATISLSVIPFFLGASRGSIFALFFPFLILMFSSLSVRNIFRIILISGIVLIALIYFDSFLDSGLLDRFTGTKEAIETGNSSASRLEIWKGSFNQFVDNPFFGDKLNTENVNHHPHNIIIEVLQSIGILGFIPFIILIIFALRYSVYIFKTNPKYGWITLFFLQALMQNLFSGSVYGAAWFWTGMALIFALRNYLFKSRLSNV